MSYNFCVLVVLCVLCTVIILKVCYTTLKLVAQQSILVLLINRLSKNDDVRVGRSHQQIELGCLEVRMPIAITDYSIKTTTN